jgi:NTP pyrophosphatase (non-canonical NTP hydrolase)
MTLNEYQEKAMRYCTQPCQNLAYMLTGLMAEVGELAGHIQKPIRADDAIFRDNHLSPKYLLDQECLENFVEMKEELLLELGDTLWMVAGFAYRLGATLEDVAMGNLGKIDSRYERGKIEGNGDHR